MRIRDCDVVAGLRKVFEQVFHVSYGSPRRQALNNVMVCLSNDSPVVSTAFGLGAQCSRGLAKGIRSLFFGGGE